MGNDKEIQVGNRRLWIGILQLASGTAVSQVIVLLTTPILTRYYTPHDFGVAGFFLSFIIFLAPFSSLNYFQAVILPRSETECLRLVRLCLGISLLFLPVFGATFFLLAPTFSSFFKMPELQSFTWIFPLAILVRSVYLVLAAYMSRRRAFAIQSKANVCQTLTERTLSLAVAFCGHASSVVMVLTRFVALITETGILLLAFVRRPLSSEEATPGRTTRELAQEYREFPLYSSWSMLLANGSSQLPMILLPLLFSPAVGGFYALGNRLLQLPMQLFGDSIRNAYYKEVTDRIHQGRDNSEGFQSLRKHLVATGMFPFVILLFFGSFIFSTVFGSAWAEAGSYVGILGFFFFFQFVSTPITCIFNAYKKQKYLMVISAALFFNNLFSLLLGSYLGSAHLGFIVLSLIGVAIYLFMNFLAERALGVGHLPQFLLYSRYLALNLPFVAGFYLVKHRANSAPMIAITSLLFGAIYYLIIFRHKFVVYLRGEVRP